MTSQLAGSSAQDTKEDTSGVEVLNAKIKALSEAVGNARNDIDDLEDRLQEERKERRRLEEENKKLRKEIDRLQNSDEFRFYVAILGFFSLGVGEMLFANGGPYTSREEISRHAIFQVVSIVTTTGYASTNFNLWSAGPKHLLFVCMFIGGMAGSTTCSFKRCAGLAS